ncbi:arylamine N-acetyltransferase family protein [Brevibacillus panacihumi]|uniref:arylamine N-acetyltransferase family protein n=1 Tax=Brevibacillus panacihumi TaxID=497735 RepID=UPI003D207728
MSELNALFRKRIGLPENSPVTFENLDEVLERTAMAIPFENLSVIQQNGAGISEDRLIAKILQQNQGGLCYELNPLLYLFLKENGLDVALTNGVVYQNESQEYQRLGRTHVAILLRHAGSTYLLDTGFGGNLPLKPVPLTGETISSFNGEFRVRKEKSEHGDHVLELKLKHKDADWRIGYAFDSRIELPDLSACNLIQKIIAEHPESPFNKTPLITKLTETGSLTLTNHSFTRWENGSMTKEDVESESFSELAKKLFSISLP